VAPGPREIALGQARRPPDPSSAQTGKGLCKPTLTHSARLDLTGARRCWVEVVAPLPMTIRLPREVVWPQVVGPLPAVPFGPWCADAWRRTVAVALALFGGRGYVMRVCIVGASGKLGQYMVRHALDRGYEVTGVCRE
jgi:hypothetical protein